MDLIISGTNREGSNSLLIAKYYQKALLQKGYKTEILSLTDLPENIITSDLYGKRSEAFKKIQEKVFAAKKFIFVIPEYNGSFPGVLKTFIDACIFPDSFYNKKAALVGLSNGRYGNVRGLEHFTGTANYCHLHILPLKIYLPAVSNELDAEGNLFHETTVKFVHEQLDKFIAY